MEPPVAELVVVVAVVAAAVVVRPTAVDPTLESAAAEFGPEAELELEVGSWKVAAESIGAVGWLRRVGR